MTPARILLAALAWSAILYAPLASSAWVAPGAPSSTPADPDPGTVLVVPPDGPDDPGRAWLGEAIAQRLPRALVELGVPSITRAERRRAEALLEIPNVRLSQATSIRIAEALGASRLVLGRHSGEGEQLTLSLRLLDVKRGTLSSPFVISGPLDSAADLVDELAWDVALAGPSRPVQSKALFLAARRVPPAAAFKALGAALVSSDASARRRSLRQVLELDPSYDEARLALVREHLEVSELDQAREIAQQVRGGAALVRESRFLQGVALLGLSRFAEAASLYEKLVAEDPTAAALNNHALAVMRSRAGKSRASDELEKVVEAAPFVPEPVFNLALALLLEGDAEAASFWARRAQQLEPSNPAARLLSSWALGKAGRAQEAAEEWRSLVAQTPSWAGLEQPDLSRRLERVLDSERLLSLDQEGRSDAELAASLLSRADKLVAAGDPEGALKALTRAAYLDPYGARIHHLLGRAHKSRGEKTEASNSLRMSLWCRDDPAVRAELASVLLDLGRAEEARVEARKVLEADPANALANAVLERRK